MKKRKQYKLYAIVSIKKNCNLTVDVLQMHYF